MTATAIEQRTAAGDAAVRRTNRTTTVAMLGGWAILLLGCVVWGRRLRAESTANLFLGAVPLFGAWHWLITVRVLVAIATGCALVVVLPAVAARGAWRSAMAAAAVGVVGWSLALAFVDAAGPRWASIHDDYGQHIGLIDQYGLGPFLRTYVARQPGFPTHLQVHPPGMVVVLWVGSHLGLHGHPFEAALALGGAAAATVAALVASREVVGEQWARRALPFVVIAPAAVWHANADVFYAGVALVGVALVIVATGHRARRAAAFAIAGGGAFGCALLLSYGVALLALPVAAVAWWRRQWTPLLLAAAGAVAVVAAPMAVGFSWIDGLAATKRQYDLNLATVRPYSYFVVANLAVFALAIGPAVVVGLSRLRDLDLRRFVTVALAVVVVADITGLSSAETERIWQPFMPLVLLAGAAVAPDARAGRRWLALQATSAVVLQTALRSPW